MTTIDRFNQLDPVTTAKSHGFTVHKNNKSFSPCPRCGAKQRGSTDTRGPCGWGDEHAGWRCLRCKEGGNNLDLLAHSLGYPKKPPKGASEWPAILKAAEDYLGGPAYDSRQANRTPVSPVDSPGPNVEGVLQQCTLLGPAMLEDEDPQIREWLTDREFDPALMERLRLIHVLPRTASALPPWANDLRHGTHRLLVPMYSLRTGEAVSVRARNYGTEGPKDRCPTGHKVKGTMMANDAARRMIRERSGNHDLDGLIICEGTTDFLRTCCAAQIQGLNLAIIAGVNGCFKYLGDIPLSPGLPVYIATDNDDTGDKYSASTLTSIGRNAHRIKLTPGTDMDDALRENGNDLKALMEPALEVAAPNPDGPRIISFATIKSKPIEWLWPGFIPLGKITLLVGNPGLGKSFVTTDLAARLSTGAPWPDGSASTPGRTLFMLAEDAPDDTVKPRLEAAKANPNRIGSFSILKDEVEQLPSLSTGLADVERMLEKEPHKLLVIDPLTAFLPGVDSHRDTEVRRTLSGLAKLADRHHIAVVCVMHLNKGQHQNALNRIGGSIAFGALARAVHTVIKHPTDEAGRLFGPIKMNIAKSPETYGFTFVGQESDTALNWDDKPSTYKAETLLTESSQANTSAVAEAMEFLTDALEDGPVPSTQLEDDADSLGISKSSLKRAKKQMGVKPKKTQDGWQCMLKESKPES